jgi:hypothetical protein
MKEIVVYDTEIYDNLFLLVSKSVQNPEKPHKVFEISPYKTDIHELMMHLTTLEAMIGFNNVRFDYPLLHFLIKMVRKKEKPKEMVRKLNVEMMKIINHENKHASTVRHPLVPQIDLLLINHYDNFAKATSLKVLEFNMKMDNIIELPFKGKHFLTKEEVEIVKEYCKNDVNATYKFFLENTDAIDFRRRFSKIYRHDFTNYNDVKIGEYILIDAIAKNLNIDIATVRKMRTHRSEMKMSDIILPYINFKRKEFNVLLDWWKNKTITQTKGQFTNLNMKDVEPLLPYCNNKTVKGKLKNLNILINDDFQVNFGTGGLHGDCGGYLFKSNEKDTIYHIDVSSYYPNLAAENGFHPAHIPKEIFISIIRMLYGQRMEAKKTGDEQTVKAVKLSLNGALYGKSNSQFSPMYDPQFMMSICVNGQLLLSMLTEWLWGASKIIQVNTDGIFILAKRNFKSTIESILDDWMKLTKLKLDIKEYNLFVQRDVNSYLAVDINGKTKRKGAFEYDHAKNKEYHKDFSMLVVPKALEAYYLHGTKPEDFIKSHPDLYDFFLRTKFDKTTKLVRRDYDNESNILREEQLQNVTRYYVSNNGNTFVKIMPPLIGMQNEREFMVEAGFSCEEMNHVTDKKLIEMKKNINYDYYIEQVNKVIRQIQIL